MAYQNVGTPRFYINAVEWLASTGTNINDIFRTLPVNPILTYAGDVSIPLGLFRDNVYVAILGHKFASETARFSLYDGSFDDRAEPTGWIVNGEGGDSESTVAEYDGFTIAEYDPLDTEVVAYNFWEADTDLVDRTAGSIIIGTYYDMPHSPDLSLTLTREYGGIKTIETKGGASLSNSFYSKPPMWGDLGAWEISNSTTNQQLSRSARRIWDLSFSYLSAKDIMAAPEVIDQTAATESIAGAGSTGGTVLTDLGWDSDDIDDNDSFAFSILDHNDFYSQVIHRTNGGQLPFIFQPDSSNNSPDAFAIAKLDMKNFKFEQVANSVYNVKLKIREVW